MQSVAVDSPFNVITPDSARRPMIVPAAATKPGGLWALGILLALYAGFLFAYFAPAICQPDDDGYFAQASLLVRNHSSWYTPESNAQYAGSVHWLLTPDGKLVSRYPAGLSVIIGAVYATFGWKAAVFTNPLLAMGTVAGLFFFVRRLTGQPLWGIAAGAVLVFNPVFFEHALAGDAHTGVACMVAWAMYFLFAWHQDRKLYQAILAGVFIGVIPTIRYPDVVMYAGFGAFVIWSAGRSQRAWGQLAVMALAAFVALLPQLIRNQLVLGAFWKTGYVLTNEQTGFGWQYFTNNFWSYIRTLPTYGMGPFIALGVVGIVAMLGLKTLRGVGLMLVGVTVPMLALYMSYYWGGGGGGGPGGGGGGGNGAGIMRFMIPTFVAYIAAGAYVLSLIAAQLPTAARIAVPIAMVALQGLWGIPDGVQQAGRVQYQKENLAEVTTQLEKVAPAGSVVVASNDMLRQLDFVKQWKLADPSNYRGTGPGMMRRGGGAEDQPNPMQPAKAKYIANKYTGTFDERKAAFAADVRKWAGSKKIYVIGTESELRNLGKFPLANAKDQTSDFAIVAKVALHQPPAEPPQRGNFGGPGGAPPGGGPPDGGPGGSQRGNFRGGGGGMMNAGTFGGATEVLIAEWKPRN